jgi:hypothetical protein
MSDVKIRPWYRIHRATFGVIAVVVAWLVFINIPGDRTLRDTGRFHHGWPYFYIERDGAARSWWSFSGASPEFHVGALLLNILTALCIAALVACACEMWIRRFGRLLRFSIASMLLVTALLAVIMGLVVRDIHRCYRQQETLDPLAELGSLSAVREERRYDWFRSLFGSQFDGIIKRVDVKADSPTGAAVPDLGALNGLTFLNLEGVILGEEDIEKLATAPALETLILDVREIRGDPEKILQAVSRLSIPWIHLGLAGDSLDDECVSRLSQESSIKSLAIKSSRVTAGVFRELGEMKSLERLWLEGALVRDADFSPLAKAPKLKEAIFFRCNLSQRDEKNLLALWPDGNLHTGTGPDGKSKLVQAFRMQQQASVDQGPGS